MVANSSRLEFGFGGSGGSLLRSSLWDSHELYIVLRSHILIQLLLYLQRWASVGWLNAV